MDLNIVPFTFGRGVTAADAARCSQFSPGKTPTARKRRVIHYGKAMLAGAAVVILCCSPGDLFAQYHHWHHRGGSGGGTGAQVASLTCVSATLTGAGSDVCTVTLSQAVSSDTTVSLASSSAAVTVPVSVAIPSGTTSASFAVAASAVSSAQAATLTASIGTSSQAFSLQLNPASTGTAALTVGSPSVAFGNVNLNTPATQTVQLTSSGTAPLTISSATVQGTGFTMSGMATPVTLNPGQTAVLSLQFNPTAAGADTGTVTITSDAASGGTATIALSGTGTAASSYAVQLSWAAPVSSDDAVTGYNVYRAVNGGTYEKLNSAVNQPTTYTDSNVQSGTAYTWEVMSVDAAGVESVASNVYAAAIP